MKAVVCQSVGDIGLVDPTSPKRPGRRCPGRETVDPTPATAR